MRFKVTEIAPDGRNKYGNYYSSGNMTRNITSVSYGGNATTTSIGTPETQIAPEVIQQYFVQAAEGSVDFTTPELEDGVTKSIGFNAQVGNEKVPIYIMDLSQVTYNNGTFSIPTNNGVTGNPSMPLTPGSGLYISFTNNGTTGTTINLQGNPNLSNWTGGTLSIPVAMYIGKGTQPQGNDLYPTDTLKSWFDAYIVYDEETSGWVLTNNVVINWVTINWTYTEVIEVTSVYALSLSNDVAMIVANADGTIPSGAYLPSCEGKLYYGSTRITGATYSIETSCPVTGLTSSTTSGVLSLGFQHPVSFSADTMEIQVSASTAGEVVDVKTFSIAKAKPGADGQSPTIYWLMTSTDSVQYNPNTSAVTPNNVTVTAYTQTGTNPISPYQGANITVEMISRSSGTGGGEDSYYGDYPSGVPISPGLAAITSKLRFRLYVDSNVVDMEDVEILMDGTNGSSGRTGAAVRGPYNYADVSGSTRIWCNGEPSQAFPESEKWIDVIIKDDVYYYCTTTYQGTLNWSQYSGNWTSGDSFDFVATNLLMAENAKINFLTGNEIYLGSGNTITGGMAGGTGSTVAFWAGNSEGNPTFSVDHNGNLNAKSGTFGIFHIGNNDSVQGLDSVEAEYEYAVDNETFNLEITPNQIYLEGKNSSDTPIQKVMLNPYPNERLVDPIEQGEYPSAAIEVWNNKYLDDGQGGTYEYIGDAFHTNAYIVADDGLKRDLRIWGTPYAGVNIATAPYCTVPLVFVPRIPNTGDLDAKATALFTHSDHNTWLFNGNDTKVSDDVYHYVNYVGLTTANKNHNCYSGMNSNLDGSFVFARDSSSSISSSNKCSIWQWTGLATTNMSTPPTGMAFINIVL